MRAITELPNGIPALPGSRIMPSGIRCEQDLYAWAWLGQIEACAAAKRVSDAYPLVIDRLRKRLRTSGLTVRSTRTPTSREPETVSRPGHCCAAAAPAYRRARRAPDHGSHIAWSRGAQFAGVIGSGRTLGFTSHGAAEARRLIYPAPIGWVREPGASWAADGEFRPGAQHRLTWLTRLDALPAGSAEPEQGRRTCAPGSATGPWRTDTSNSRTAGSCCLHLT